MLTQALSWHWIFFINVPIGIVTAARHAPALVPDEGIGLGNGADVLGAVLITGALMLGVYAIVGRRVRLGLAAHARAARRLSLALLAGFVLRQAPRRGAAHAAAHLPLAQRRGGERRPDAVVAGLFGMFFLGSLYLQQVLGYDAAPDRPRLPARAGADRCAVAGYAETLNTALRRPSGRADRRA